MMKKFMVSIKTKITKNDKKDTYLSGMTNKPVSTIPFLKKI